MGLIYLDSSIGLRTILDVPERRRLQTWLHTPDSLFVSSRLLRTEVIRVLRREKLATAAATPLFDRVGLIDITCETHTRAESIERHVKSLDALHLATAMLVGGQLTVATHDVGMKDAAEHLGFATFDPVDQTKP